MTANILSPAGFDIEVRATFAILRRDWHSAKSAFGIRKDVKSLFKGSPFRAALPKPAKVSFYS